VPRLRRSDPTTAGWTRVRRGRGFSYQDQSGHRLSASDAQRCKDLAIPPAWVEVWICPWDNGHIQALGTDDAGRRQYLYHPQWREERDREKFDRVLEFGRSLPEARRVAARDLARSGMPRERALAVAFRILDLRGLRIGSEDYSSFGLATLRRDHVNTRAGRVHLSFPGKAGKGQDIVIDDPDLLPAVRHLLRRRARGAELLAWRDRQGWHDVSSQDINDYLAEIGVRGTAKDFRTWQAGLRTLASLSAADGSPSRAVTEAIRDAAEHLGNTPAIARSSYVDPRVVQAYLDGEDLPALDTDQLQKWESALLALLWEE
jgi:DNA topoisomerase-1